MGQRVVLVTGCSSGIGLTLAAALASHPDKAFKVYATMRDLSKQQRLLEQVKGVDGQTLVVLQMDVTDQQSILQARGRVEEKHLDILVCNAGVGLMGPLEAQSVSSMQKVLEVNLLGTIRTIQAFLPDMKARSRGHILVTGSTGGLHGLPFNELYCASKFAIEGFCESLAVLLQHFNIHVSLIECGPVNTDFLLNVSRAEVGDEALQGVDSRTLSLYQRFLQHCNAVFLNAAQEPAEVVKVFLEAIHSPRPAFRYFSSDAIRQTAGRTDGLQDITDTSNAIFSAGGQP